MSLVHQQRLMDSQLLEAAGQGDLPKLRDAIEKGANVDAFTEFGKRAALHSVATRGNMELVRYLVDECHASLDQADQNGRTALWYASREGRADMVQYLSQHPRHIAGMEEYTLCVQEACWAGSLDVVQYLVEERCAPLGGGMSLRNACWSGNLSLVRYLVEHHHVDVHTPDGDFREMAVLVASERGHMDIVEYLVGTHKADFNVKQEDGSSPFSAAFDLGHTDVAKYLLAREGLPERIISSVAIVMAKNKLPDFNEKLLDAAWFGSVLEAKEAVRCGASVDAATNEEDGVGAAGRTPLHLACDNGHLPMVVWLVQEAGANVNAQDTHGWTPLHLACSMSELKIVQYLVENAHAKTDIVSCSGNTALDTIRTSEEREDSAHVEEFLVNIARKKAVAGLTANETLQWSATEGWLEGVVQACSAGASVDEQDKDGDSALHMACRVGHVEVVQYLVDVAQADLSLRNKQGRSPLDDAEEGTETFVFLKRVVAARRTWSFLLDVQQGNVAMVRHCLLEGGASANAVDKQDGRKTSALMLACENGHLDVVQLLLDHGANMMAKNNNLQTASHVAALHGHLAILQTILAKATGFKSRPGTPGKTVLAVKLVLESKDITGRRALHCSAQQGHIHIAKWLIQTGVDVHAADYNKQTCLHMACQHGNIESAKLFLSSAPDKRRFVEAKDNEGMTALHCALRRGQVHVALWLISQLSNLVSCCRQSAPNRAENVNVQDNNGQTALHLACKLGFFSIVKQLVEEGKADTEVKDRAGRMAVHVAQEAGRHDIDSYLTRVPKLEQRLVDIDFHVFISHAGEQKHSIAVPIYNGLCNSGVCRPFIDKQDLPVGYNGHSVLKETMNSAPIGVFILSPEFVAKEWPMKELLCFLERYEGARSRGVQPLCPLLIPVFANLSWADCSLPPEDFFLKFHTTFSNPSYKFWERVQNGETSPERVMDAIKRLKVFGGIENRQPWFWDTAATTADLLAEQRGRRRTECGLVEDSVREILKQWGELKAKLG